LCDEKLFCKVDYEEHALFERMAQNAAKAENTKRADPLKSDDT